MSQAAEKIIKSIKNDPGSWSFSMRDFTVQSCKTSLKITLLGPFAFCSGEVRPALGFIGSLKVARAINKMCNERITRIKHNLTEFNPTPESRGER